MSEIGFLGTGTMGATVARIVATQGGQILVSNRTVDKAKALAEEIGARVSDNQTIAKECKMIFLGVKPQMMPQVCAEIAPILAQRRDKFTLVSMAAGVTLAKIQALAGGAYPVIRMMPNLPLVVQAGVVEYCATEGCEDLAYFAKLLSTGGLIDFIPESQMDAASAISGCGPAFCAMFLEAMADGGVLCGLSREQAMKYAAQTMIGTGEMVLQQGIHPAVLKDGVCSPAGTTIQGVAVLEQGCFSGTTIGSICAAYEKSQELGRK